MILKIPWKQLSAALAVAIIGWGAYAYYQQNVRVNPQALLEEAVGKTQKEVSYRYHVEVTQEVEGRQELLSKVEGERSNGQDYHLKGEISRNRVEVYQLGDTTYMRNLDSAKWSIFTGNRLLDQSLFMAEIDPMASFNFTEMGAVKYLGREKQKGRRVVLLETAPVVENDFLQMFFKDLRYRLLVDQKSRLIVGAEIRALSKGNARSTVTMRVELYDFGARIALQPPAGAKEPPKNQ